MTAQGNHRTPPARVDSLLRTPDAAPWREAPAGLHDRVMASLDAAPSPLATGASQPRIRWRAFALAACVSIVAGGLGLFVGSGASKTSPASADLAAASGAVPTVHQRPAPIRTEAPTVVLSRAFDDLKPAGSSRLMASMAAPMRSEAQGLAAETRLAARTVLSRLPFVSME